MARLIFKKQDGKFRTPNLSDPIPASCSHGNYVRPGTNERYRMKQRALYVGVGCRYVDLITRRAHQSAFHLASRRRAEARVVGNSGDEFFDQDPVGDFQRLGAKTHILPVFPSSVISPLESFAGETGILRGGRPSLTANMKYMMMIFLYNLDRTL